jgi:hypothetical protein
MSTPAKIETNDTMLGLWIIQNNGLNMLETVLPDDDISARSGDRENLFLSPLKW